MTYPLSDTFATAPANGYTTVLGSMAASYNGAQQAIDISAPNVQSILRFNETASGDFWFEADIEFLTDPSTRKHIGLWMSTDNGAEGYRFAHLDGGWSASRWNSGFGDGAAVTGSVNDGAKPIAGLLDTAPGFEVGQRMILRCEIVSGAFDTNGVPWTRLIQFKVGGVVMFQVIDAAYRGNLVPGVFLYGATARIHAIAGDVPSGLPAFPAVVGVDARADFSRLNSPLNELWSRGGCYDDRFHDIPNGRKNIYFSGSGQITGTVKEKGQPDLPLVRQVLLYSENTHTLVAATWSDAAGNYRFELLDTAQRYTVVSTDYRQMYRAVIADNLRPEAMP